MPEMSLVDAVFLGVIGFGTIACISWWGMSNMRHTPPSEPEEK